MQLAKNKHIPTKYDKLKNVKETKVQVSASNIGHYTPLLPFSDWENGWVRNINT